MGEADGGVDGAHRHSPAWEDVFTPEAGVRMLRRVDVFPGLVPLPDTTDEETAWTFRQVVRRSE